MSEPSGILLDRCSSPSPQQECIGFCALYVNAHAHIHGHRQMGTYNLYNTLLSHNMYARTHIACEPQLSCFIFFSFSVFLLLLLHSDFVMRNAVISSNFRCQTHSTGHDISKSQFYSYGAIISVGKPQEFSYCFIFFIMFSEMVHQISKY